MPAVFSKHERMHTKHTTKEGKADPYTTVFVKASCFPPPLSHNTHRNPFFPLPCLLCVAFPLASCWRHARPDSELQKLRNKLQIETKHRRELTVRLAQKRTREREREREGERQRERERERETERERQRERECVCVCLCVCVCVCLCACACACAPSLFILPSDLI